MTSFTIAIWKHHSLSFGKCRNWIIHCTPGEVVILFVFLLTALGICGRIGSKDGVPGDVHTFAVWSHIVPRLSFFVNGFPGFYPDFWNFSEISLKIVLNNIFEKIRKEAENSGFCTEFSAPFCLYHRILGSRSNSIGSWRRNCFTMGAAISPRSIIAWTS